MFGHYIQCNYIICNKSKIYEHFYDSGGRYIGLARVKR